MVCASLQCLMPTDEILSAFLQKEQQHQQGLIFFLLLMLSIWKTVTSSITNNIKALSIICKHAAWRQAHHSHKGLCLSIYIERKTQFPTQIHFLYVERNYHTPLTNYIIIYYIRNLYSLLLIYYLHYQYPIIQSYTLYIFPIMNIQDHICRNWRARSFFDAPFSIRNKHYMILSRGSKDYKTK